VQVLLSSSALELSLERCMALPHRGMADPLGALLAALLPPGEPELPALLSAALAQLAASLDDDEPQVLPRQGSRAIRPVAFQSDHSMAPLQRHHAHNGVMPTGHACMRSESMCREIGGQTKVPHGTSDHICIMQEVSEHAQAAARSTAALVKARAAQAGSPAGPQQAGGRAAELRQHCEAQAAAVDRKSAPLCALQAPRACCHAPVASLLRVPCTQMPAGCQDQPAMFSEACTVPATLVVEEGAMARV
jgi:hypothetical protein